MMVALETTTRKVCFVLVQARVSLIFDTVHERSRSLGIQHGVTSVAQKIIIRSLFHQKSVLAKCLVAAECRPPRFWTVLHSIPGPKRLPRAKSAIPVRA